MNKKYQWDLDHMLDGQSYEQLENKYFKTIKEFCDLFLNDPFKDEKSFDEWNKKEDQLKILQNRLFNYVSNNLSADLSSKKFNSLQQQLSFKLVEPSTILSTLSNVILKNKKKIEEYLKQDKFKHFARNYYLVFRTKKHILSDEISKYQSTFLQLEGSYEDLFSTLLNRELNINPAKDKTGRLHTIPNRETYMMYLTKKDRVLRKNAYVNYTQAVHGHRETFAKLLYNYYLKENVDGKNKKFKGYIDQTNFYDEVSNDFVLHVYDEVKKYNKLNEEFNQVRKSFLAKKHKLDRIQPWDRMLEISGNNEKISIEEAQEISLSALGILGDQYVKNVKRSYDENWIDWEVKANKRGGAYCIGGSYGLKKVNMLLNYKHKLYDVSTLVHEIGHAMHAVEFNQYQKTYAGNAIIFAEIPSIANEVLLSYYLLEKYKNSKLKKLEIYDALLTNFFATTSRQISFSKFEYESNELINSGQPYNADVAEQIYHKVSTEYLTTRKTPKKLKGLDKKNLTFILTVPHFYSGIFYVYKYSIGQVGALLTADRIFNNQPKALEQYYTFLRSGVSLPPLETIKLLGIDLEKSEPWTECGEVVKKWLSEYKKLIKQLTKK